MRQSFVFKMFKLDSYLFLPEGAVKFIWDTLMGSTVDQQMFAAIMFAFLQNKLVRCY